MVRIYLSRLLGERRIKQSDLAAITGIRKNTISDIYHEECKTISVEHMNLICEALNCKLSEFIDYIPDTQNKA